MAADRNDQPGVLGNLPRSRPGRRSEKRTTGSRAKQAAAKPSASSPRSARAGAARKPAGATRTAAPPRSSQQPQARPAAAQRAGGGDPLSQAVGLAGKVAAVGVRTAAGIVKRLPRP